MRSADAAVSFAQRGADGAATTESESSSFTHTSIIDRSPVREIMASIQARTTKVAQKPLFLAPALLSGAKHSRQNDKRPTPVKEMGFSIRRGCIVDPGLHVLFFSTREPAGKARSKSSWCCPVRLRLRLEKQMHWRGGWWQHRSSRWAFAPRLFRLTEGKKRGETRSSRPPS